MPDNPLFHDDNPAQAVSFATVWKALGALAFVMLTALCGLGFTWGIWVTTTLNGHDKALAILQDRRGDAKGVTQSVNVGDAAHSAEAEQATSGRDWLTTQEVARREKVTDRTIINWIAEGLIDPAPVKAGREYQFAAQYRIRPNEAEDCGKEPKPEENTP